MIYPTIRLEHDKNMCDMYDGGDGDFVGFIGEIGLLPGRVRTDDWRWRWWWWPLSLLTVSTIDTHHQPPPST